MSVAISNMVEQIAICTVAIETRIGDKHVFPGMDKKALEMVIPKGSSATPGIPSLGLVNVSFVVLVIPFQLIKRISVDGEEWWVCPA